MLSIVVPMYNESDGIAILSERLPAVLETITKDWEVICINDGSRDDTLERIKAWQRKEPRIKLISLSRNFGKEAALTAGLEHAFGQAVIPMDADMQDPPEIISDMVSKWKEGYKVVIATRKSRNKDSWIKRTTAAGFYRTIRQLSDTPIPANTGDFRLMDQSVVKVVRLLPERSRFMKGLFAWVGFNTTQVYFDRAPRAAGTAHQSLTKLIRLAADGITSFTTLPLQLATYLGLVISFVAFGYGGWLLIRTIIFGVDVPGYASIMASVLCMGGIQLVCIGILGQYLGRVYNETKKRPIYVIEETSGISPSQTPR
jgi:polyisoprenyl-phosphate glycosyltransferase